MDVDSDSFKLAFTSLLDSLGVSQKVKEPTHCFNHILDLVLTYGIDTHHLLVSPLNSLLSDHFLVTFEFSICGIKTENETCHYSRCLSEDAVNNFKEVILSHLPMVEYDRIAEGNDPAYIDHLVNNTADMLHSALDAVAPLRKRVSYLRSSAPWYNSHIHKLKQKARKMERRWYSCKLRRTTYIHTYIHTHPHIHTQTQII